MRLDKIDKNLIKLVSNGLANSTAPFKSLAKNLNLTESSVIRRLKTLKRKGVITRFSGKLNYNNLGYKNNALVLWKLEGGNINNIRNKIVKIPFISHAYIRKAYADFAYNLYTMIHARTERELNAVIESLEKKLNINNYKVLHTLRELKKSYFIYNG